MTTVLDTYPVRRTGHVGRLVLDQVAVQLPQVRRRYRIWRDRQHLHALPDYLLKDIGIGRSEIDSVTECDLSDWSRQQPRL